MRPEVSCARRSTESSDRVLEPLGLADGAQKGRPIGFVRPLDFDLDRLRRPDHARADVREIFSDEHERDVGRQERRIGGPLLDEDADRPVFGAGVAGRFRNQRLGIREHDGHAEGRLALHDLLAGMNRAAQQKATGSRGRDVANAGPVHGIDDGDCVGEVLVRLARVEDRAVRALVLDDDVALSEHPFAEERRDRLEVGASTRAAPAAFGAGTRSSVLPWSTKVLPRRARMPCASVRAQRG